MYFEWVKCAYSGDNGYRQCRLLKLQPELKGGTQRNVLEGFFFKSNFKEKINSAFDMSVKLFLRITFFVFLVFFLDVFFGPVSMIDVKQRKTLAPSLFIPFSFVCKIIFEK